MRIGFSSSVVMPKSWNSSQSLGRCCTSGEMICFGAFSSDSALATTKAFRPVSGSNGMLRDLALVELLDVHAAVMGQRHGRRAEAGASR